MIFTVRILGGRDFTQVKNKHFSPWEQEIAMDTSLGQKNTAEYSFYTDQFKHCTSEIFVKDETKGYLFCYSVWK